MTEKIEKKLRRQVAEKKIKLSVQNNQTDCRFTFIHGLFSLRSNPLKNNT